MIMKLYILFGLWFIVFVDGRKECIPRKGKDTIYCVCNSTYCDDLDKIVAQPKGTSLVFETNKKGDRFKSWTLKFEKTSSVNTSAENTFRIWFDRNKKYQKINGFGGAFTDAAGINLKKLSDELSRNVIKDYFGDTGIEATIGRVPMAGCDFSARGYTYDDNPNDFDLKMWKLQDEDHNYKIPYIKYAKNISTHGLKLFGSPWSPPAWMKRDNNLRSGAHLFGNPGEKYYKTWANYFVKFLDAYKEQGLNFWGLTVENEPSYPFPPFYGWNGLGMTPAEERDFVKLDLGPALVKAGYTPDKLNVMVYDHGPGGGVKLFDGAHTCFNDTEAAKYLRGTAFHCYGANNVIWPVLDILNELYPNKFIMMTECCQGFTASPTPTGALQHPGNWNNAQTYASDIMNNLLHWTTGWVEWNLVLDMYGKPNWADMMGEAPIMVNTTHNEYYKDAKFYVMGHFFKFLVPESQRIKINTSPKTNDQFDCVAFVRPDGSTVLIVRNSNHNKDIEFVIDDSSSGGKLSARIGSDSVQTYIFWQ